MRGFLLLEIKNTKEQVIAKYPLQGTSEAIVVFKEVQGELLGYMVHINNIKSIGVFKFRSRPRATSKSL